MVFPPLPVSVKPWTPTASQGQCLLCNLAHPHWHTLLMSDHPCWTQTVPFSVGSSKPNGFRAYFGEPQGLSAVHGWATPAVQGLHRAEASGMV